MKKIYIFFLWTTFFRISLTYAQFAVQTNLSVKPTPHYLRDVKFADANIGWSVGDFGTIIKTTDGGTTWILQTSNTFVQLNAIAVLSTSNVVVVGASSTILRTTDGGATWTSNTISPSFTIQDIHPISTTTWILVGDGGRIFRTTDAGDNWTSITSPTTQQLLGVHFPSTSIGYAVGASGTAIKTTDGGLTWTILSTGQTYFLYDVFFTNDNTGYAVGGSSPAVLKTSNGGTTWTQTMLTGSSIAAQDVHFADANNGWIGGGGQGAIWRTNNAGASWTIGGNAYVYCYGIYATSATKIIAVGSGGIRVSTNAGVTFTPLDDMAINRQVSKIEFASSSVVYATGYDRHMKSTDGGNNWSRITSLAFDLFYAVDFLDDNTGWVVGSGATGIKKTTNGGTSWTTQTPPISTSYYDIEMLSGTLGWIVGDGGNIFKTTDGNTWSAQTSGTTQNLRAVNFIDANNGWAVGFNGTTLRTTNGGTTWTSVSLPSVGTAALRDVYFKDLNKGWICGNPANVWRTTDGGATWQIISLPYTGNERIQVNSEGAVYIASSYDIVVSYDNGATFTTVPKPKISSHITTFRMYNDILYIGSEFSTVVSQTKNYTRWNGTSWSDGVPTASIDAWLDADYSTSLHGNLTCRRLALSEGKNLFINAGGDITANSGFSRQGTVYNACGGTLNVTGGTFGSGSTILNQPEINLQGNSITIPLGSTTPSLTNHTQFVAVSIGGSSTRTFTIQNTGIAQLAISSITLSGTNANQFSINMIPSSPIAPSSSTTFQITFSPTSLGTKTATITLVNNDCDENVYTFTIAGECIPPNNGLAFNGTSSIGTPYVQVNNHPDLQVSNNFTVEAWVKPFSRATPRINTIIGKKADGGSQPGWALFINSYSFGAEDRKIIFETQSAKCETANNTITLNTWQHIAVSITNGTPHLYLNGTLIPWSSTSFNPTNSTQPLQIGALGNNAFPFNGQIDEVRIWNTGRTCTEINAYKDIELSGSEPGLIAYYNFNHGTPGGTNTGITTLVNQAATGAVFNGTLTGFNLTGTASNWIDATGTGVMPGLPANLPNLVVKGNNTIIYNGDTSPSASDFTEFIPTFISSTSNRTFVLENSGTANLTGISVSLTGANADQFSIATPPSTTIANGGSSNMVISFSPTSTGVKTATITISHAGICTPYTFVINGTGDVANKALDFDGTNDYISQNTTSGLVTGNANHTVEFWVKYKGGQTGDRWIALFGNFTTAHQTQLIGIDGATGRIKIYHYATGNDLTATTATLPTNIWTHVAIIYIGTTRTNYIYLNGNFVETLTYTTDLNLPPNMPLQLVTSNPVFSSNVVLDEFRFWNEARTCSQIKAYKDVELTGSEPNLGIYYSFNQGVAGGNNISLSTINDLTTYANHASLVNFALNGTTSNLIDGTATGVTSGSPSPQPEIKISGNGNEIPIGSMTPSVANDTDFGTVAVASSLSKTFTLENTGTATLSLIGSPRVQLIGSSDFSVTAQPPTASVSGSGSTTFEITFSPSSYGLKTATVSVSNNDCDEGTYTFAIAGMGDFIVTTWNGTTWSNGVPTASHEAIFAADYSTQLGNITAGKMTINAGATVKILSSGNINVTTQLSNSGTINTCAGGTITFGTLVGNAINHTYSEVPTINPSITISQLTSYGTNIAWTGGNGSKRIVILKVNSPINTNVLTDGVTYTVGQSIDGGTVVYNNNGSSLIQTGLTPSTTYYVAVLEYNESCGIPEYKDDVVQNMSFTTYGATTWNGSTWSNGIPDATKDAFVNANYSTLIQGNFVTPNLIIAPSAILTIHASGSVTANAAQAGMLLNNGQIRQCTSGNLTYTYDGGGTGSLLTNYNDAPTIPASSLVTSNISSSRTTISWTNGNGMKRLVIVKAATTVNPSSITNGITYTASTIFTGSGDMVDGGKVVYVGTGSTVTVTQLTANTFYHVSIFEYNENCGSPYYQTTLIGTTTFTTLQNTVWNGVAWSNGTPDNTKEVILSAHYDTDVSGNIAAQYLTILSGITLTIQNAGSVVIAADVENNGIINRCASGVFTFGGMMNGSGIYNATYPFNPTIESSSLNITKITAGTVEFNWTIGNGQKRIVVLKPSASVNVNAPIDGTTYTADADMLGSSDVLDGGKVVFNGTGNSITVINLVANTTYHYAIFEYNESCSTTNYATGSPLAGSFTMSDVPFAPTTLTATTLSSTSISLQWNDTNSFETNYYVERSIHNNTSFTQIAVLPPNTTSYTVNGLLAGTTYYFRVRAAEYINYSPYSIEASARTLLVTPTLLPPTNITHQSFQISWTTIIGATSYQIDVATDPSFMNFVPGYSAFSVTNNSLTVTSLNGNTMYYVRVRAMDGPTPSFNSNHVTVLTLPSSPSISSTSNISETNFKVNWLYLVGISEYQLDVAHDANFTQILTGFPQTTNLNSLLVSGLQPGTTYYCRLRVKNLTGFSPYSTTVPVLTLPDPPVALTPTLVSPSYFVAGWKSVASANQYLLEVSPYENFSTLLPEYNPSVVSDTSKQVNGLQAGKTYYFRIKAKNATGESAYSNVISLPTVADIPSPLAPSVEDLGEDFFVASWEKIEGAEHYLLDVATDSLFENILPNYQSLQTTGLTVRIEGLQAGTYYYYRLKSVNASGESEFSEVVKVLTKPAAPQIVSTVAITTNSFSFSWSEITGAFLGYSVEVAKNQSFSPLLASYPKTVTSTSITVSNLEAGTTYYLRVKALNQSGESPSSEMGTVLTLPAPPLAKEATEVKTTSFVANWQTVKSAEKYQLEIATDESFSQLIRTTEVSENMTSITNLLSASTYYYRVRAINATGTSEYSQTIIVFTFPNRPSITSMDSITENSFVLTWNAVERAEKYLVEIAKDAGFEQKIPSIQTTSTKTKVVGLEAGTIYFVRIRAVGLAGEGENSASQQVLTLPNAPILEGSTAYVDKLLMAWSAVKSATVYVVEVSILENFENLLPAYPKEVSGTSIEITNLVASQSYFIRLKAKNQTGFSEYSPINRLTTLPSDVTALEPMQITDKSFVARWRKNEKATNYELEVANEQNFSSSLRYVVQDTFLLVGNLQPNTRYFYRVRVRALEIESKTSNVVTLITAPLPPVFTITNITETSFELRWSAINGATDYFLDISSEENFTKFVIGFENKLVSTTSTIVSGLNPLTVYYVRMRTKGEMAVSHSSAVSSVQTMPLPPVIDEPANVTENSFSVKWSSQVSGEFSIDVALDENFLNKLLAWNGKKVQGNNVVVEELSSGTSYFVRVKSVSPASNYSNVANVVTIPAAPVALAASLQNSTSFVANWQTTKGSSEYQVTVATDETMNNVLSGYPKNTSQLELLVDNLASFASYFYRVRAVNKFGISAPSQVIATKTASAPPIAESANEVSSTRFRARWQRVENVNAYLLEVAQDETFRQIIFTTQTNETTTLVEQLIEGTTYFYRVRALVQDGNVLLQSSNSNVISVYLPKVPKGLRITNPTAEGFTLSWNEDEKAELFAIEISEKEDFSVLTSGYPKLLPKGTSVVLNNLRGNVKYFARMMSISANWQSSKSTVVSQLTLPPLPDIARISRIAEKRTTKIEWFYSNIFTQNLQNLKFSIERSDNEGEPFKAITSQDLPFNAKGMIYEDFTAITRLRATYRLIAKNDAGQSVLTFEQRIITSVENVLDEENWTLYPIPARENIFLKMPIGVKEVSLQVIDMQGRKHWWKEIDISDSEPLKILLEKLPSGTYILEIRHEGNTIHKKFVK